MILAAMAALGLLALGALVTMAGEIVWHLVDRPSWTDADEHAYRTAVAEFRGQR